MSVRFMYSTVIYSEVSLLIFSPGDLSINVNMALRSPNIIVSGDSCYFMLICVL